MVHTVYFFRLQTVCLTAIFNFPFSTFNLKKLSLWHNMFFYITNCLHELGAAACRITNKKVGKQKFCIKNLLPDFNFFNL